MLALIVFISAVVWLLWYFHARNQGIKRIGLPGPEPEYIFGTMRYFDPLSQRPLFLEKMVAQYGDTFGTVEGNMNFIVTKDVHVLHDVFVRKFPNFHGRLKFPLQGDVDDERTLIGVFAARGNRWKRLRTITNSCFTTANLKALMPTMQDCVDTLVRRFHTEGAGGRTFQTNPLFADMTVDVIARVAFGERRNLQVEGDTEYGVLARAIFSSQTTYRYIASLFPELRTAWRALFMLYAWLSGRVPAYNIFRNMAAKVEQRKARSDSGVAEERAKPDLLQMMINAEHTDKEQPLTPEINNNKSARAGPVALNKKMTANEILAQSNEVLFAGSETTSNTLTYAAHHLATQADVQRRLYEEICDRAAHEEQPSYDTLLGMEYLDGFVKEILRLYPHTSAVHVRECSHECTVGRPEAELRVPKGYFVQANTWAIHHDKALWGDDAMLCRPDRWLEPKPLKHPMAYMPFGFGPRICLGMRLALLELKMTIVALLRQFEFSAAQETKTPVEFTDGVGTVQMASSWLRVTARSGHSE